MKKQTFQLNKMGLTEMTKHEMKETDGGGFWSFLASIGIAAFVVGIGMVLTAGTTAAVALGLWVGAGGALATGVAALEGYSNGNDDFNPFGIDLTPSAP